MEHVLKVTKQGLLWTNRETSKIKSAPDWYLSVRGPTRGLIIAKPVIKKTYTDKMNIRNYKRKEWKPLPLTEQQNNMLSLRNRKY